MMITSGSSRGTLEFDVFEHASGRYEAVKHGFSWPAFFFTFVWAFVKRLWLLGVVVLGLAVAAAFAPGFQEFVQRVFGDGGLGLVISLILGFKGNEWKRQHLIERGWRHVTVVEATHPQNAIEEAKRLRQAEQNAAATGTVS